jgi:SAM-dependent methyltransferase
MRPGAQRHEMRSLAAKGMRGCTRGELSHPRGTVTVRMEVTMIAKAGRGMIADVGTSSAHEGVWSDERRHSEVGSGFEEDRLRETIAAYDVNASSYADRFKSVDLTDHRQRFVHRLPDRTGIVLDAGCGPGRDLGLFRTDGVRAVGIDRSAALLGKAAIAGYSVIEADLRCIPTESQVFDGVWACASLLHLSSVQMASALAEFNRVLRPGGALFLSVVHGAGVEHRVDRTGQARWFYLYSAPLLERLLEEAGFVDVDARVEPGVVRGTWVNVHARSGCD